MSKAVKASKSEISTKKEEEEESEKNLAKAKSAWRQERMAKDSWRYRKGGKNRRKRGSVSAAKYRK